MSRILRSLSSKRRKGKEPQVRIEEPQQTPQTHASNEPLPLPTLKFHNPLQKSIHTDLKKRIITPCRHYHIGDMIKLGINEDLWLLFENLRIGVFVNSAFRTYLEPTREFLASFSTTPVGDADFEITFQLFNVHHTLSLREFNAALDFNPDADLLFPEYENFNVYAEYAWWNAISGKEQFTARYSLESDVFQLCLRVLHRLLGYSVFPKQDLGKMSKLELVVL